MRPCTCLHALRTLSRPVRSLPRQLHPSFSRSASSTPPAPPTATDGPAAAPAAGTSKSSCPPGTRLTGLNYLKAGADPVAMEDSEYPAWLWKLTETKAASASTTPEGRLAEAGKALRIKGRKGIKTSNSLTAR